MAARFNYETKIREKFERKKMLVMADLDVLGMEVWHNENPTLLFVVATVRKTVEDRTLKRRE